jgi:hypothetical protein
MRIVCLLELASGGFKEPAGVPISRSAGDPARLERGVKN